MALGNLRLASRSTVLATAILALGVAASAQLEGLPQQSLDGDLPGLLCQTLKIGCPPAPETATLLWAHVGADGTLLAGSHATAASKASDVISLGAYVVTFDRDVDGCAATASPGAQKVEGNGYGFSPNILLGVSAPPFNEDANQAYIGWTPPAGSQFTDIPFFLIVACGPKAPTGATGATGNVACETGSDCPTGVCVNGTCGSQSSPGGKGGGGSQ